MTREEALQNFMTHSVRSKCDEARLQTEKCFFEHRDRLVAEMVQGFIDFLRKIADLQQRGVKGKINFIFCSYLYSAHLRGEPIWRLDAYDKNHYFDDKECSSYFDTPWLFAALNKACQELDLERKKYIGKISSAQIDRIKRREAYYYTVFPTLLARKALKEVVKTPEFEAIEKAKKVVFRIGEYRDQTEIVYVYNGYQKDSKKAKAFLEKKKSIGYFCNCFTNLDLSGGDYSGTTLSYARFTKSILKKVECKDATLYGIEMDQCIIEDTSFEESCLSGAIFEESTIVRTSFKACYGSAVKLYQELDVDDEILVDIFSGVRFCKGTLEEVDFSASEFEQANFEGATLERVWFEDCILKGANFKDSHLRDCTFYNVDLRESCFEGAVLENCRFEEVELYEAQIPQEVLSAMNLDEEQLEDRVEV